MCIQLMKKPLKLDEKNKERKPGTRSIKNLLNLMKKQGGKSIIALYFTVLQGVKNVPNLATKMVKENLMLIGDRDEPSKSIA